MTVNINGLGRITGEARRIAESYGFAAEADAAFDGGEWSGPASARACARELDELATAVGFVDYDELYAEITRRTSGHWVYVNLPSAP